MNESDLEKVIYQEPFQPFRLLLADGEEVSVTRPRKAHVSGGYVAVGGVSRRPDGASKQGLRIIRVDLVASVEPIALEGPTP